MTQTNRPLNKKTLMVSPHDRYVGSVVPHSLNSNIQPDHTSSLRPHFIKKSKSDKITFAGFPLLRKEPYTDRNSLDKIKNQSNQTAISLPPLYAKPPSLCCKSDTDQNSDIFYIPGSFITHGLIILIIYLLSAKFPSSPTNGNSEQGQPVDVVFMPTKTGTSGLTGAGVSGEDGQTPPPPPPADLPEESQPPLPEETVPLPQPETDPLPPDTGEIPIPIPKEPTKTPKKQPLKNHQYTYRYTPQRQQRRPQRSTPERSSNPFENMQTLDFSENPNKSKRRAATHKLPQGSRSSIDLSTGPLVKNGKINTPYAFKVNIKGVSDDYGDAINAWIRQHLYYPSDAARNGEDGSASVHVTLNRDGYVLSVSLTNSSGSDTLDAAITGMFRGARLPKIPPDLPDHFELDLTINYILIRQ